MPVWKDLRHTLKVFSSIRPNFIGLDEKDWQGLDAFLQELIPGERQLSLALSISLASAGTGNCLWRLRGIKKAFPCPFVNMLTNRGMQGFLTIPFRAKTPQEAVAPCLEAHKVILEELRERKALLGTAPDGSWFTNLDFLKALELVCSLAGDWGMKIGIDFSGQALWNGRTYMLGPKKLAPRKYLDFVEETAKSYRVYYLEDPFHRGDFESHSKLARSLMPARLLAGRGLYQGGPGRLKKGMAQKAGNGIVITPALSGTLSEFLRLPDLALKGGFTPILSQAQRETEDSWLSDLSILSGARALKIGPGGSEGMAKLNRLTELWHEIPDPSMAELP